MYHDFNYERTLATSLRAQWMLDDVLRVDQDLDFSRLFMPESLARTAALGSLDAFEQRALNQISAHQYLSIFGIVEEFILPFLLDHAREVVNDDDWRIRALLNFAGEEAKHIHLFKRFHAAFERGFPVECQVIGPSADIGAEVLRHDPLAVGLVILMIEWMTQEHYLGSIRDDGDLDPLFKSLMLHHWKEELDITAQQNVLVVSGRKKDESDEKGSDYIYRGIATRSFERRFALADHIQVRGADMRDGLLSIELVREIPEAMKPKKIDIGGSKRSERSAIGSDQPASKQTVEAEAEHA
jgi:hypothetical protein